MIRLWLLPLILQGVFIITDEFLFHRARGLPKWEIWGHPLDTFTVAVPFGIVTFTAYSPTLLNIFIFLSVVSCLFVTKDEFIHAHVCSKGEHWLHAVLFILHPTAFFAAGILWKEGVAHEALKIQFVLILLFMLYQILYWSFYGPRLNQKSHQ